MRKPVTELDANVPEEKAADARAWEGLAEWTGDLPPDQIEALAAPSVRDITRTSRCAEGLESP